MKKPHLVLCPACARHVRVSEHACPFCAAALPDALRQTPPPRRLPARLSRAAIFALGTSGTTAAVLACSDTSSPKTEPAMVDAAYGGPPGSDRDSGFDAGADVLLASEAYGAPPFDGSPLVDAAYGGPPPSDAGDAAPQLVDAAYGGPPFDSGG